LKTQINKILSKLFGYHLAKSNVNPVELLFGSAWFKKLAITHVIDVGANRGQFALQVKKVIPKVNVISFEPIPADYLILKQKFAALENCIAHNLAVGEKDGEIQFEINDFSPTSSILKTTILQKEYYPITGEVTKVTVAMTTLDSFFKNYTTLKGNILLKIDVQGYESFVLKGAKNFLNQVKIVYIECSFKEFYKDQALFHELYSELHNLGFEFRGVGDQLKAGKNYEPVQIDAIFINKNL
jgi:FkbM family methyltransferase